MFVCVFLLYLLCSRWGSCVSFAVSFYWFSCVGRSKSYFLSLAFLFYRFFSFLAFFCFLLKFFFVDSRVLCEGFFLFVLNCVFFFFHLFFFFEGCFILGAGVFFFFFVRCFVLIFYLFLRGVSGVAGFISFFSGGWLVFFLFPSFRRISVFLFFFCFSSSVVLVSFCVVMWGVWGFFFSLCFFICFFSSGQLSDLMLLRFFFRWFVGSFFFFVCSR